MLNTIKQLVFVDLDGVLADLDGTLAHYDGYACPLAWFRSRYEKHLTLGDFYYNVISKHLNSNSLFETLRPMSDFSVLYNFLHSLTLNNDVCVFVCTSAMNNNLSKTVTEQKMRWIEKHLHSGVHGKFIEDVLVSSCQPSKVGLVQETLLKYNCTNAVMIDDMLITKNSFDKVSIPCILHTSAISTIRQYEEMYK